jgi:predicted GNAT family acetyltransferase
MDPATAATGPDVIDNPQESRFEIRVGDTLAGVALYHLRGQEISIIHTEVDDEFQGLGLAGKLARAVLDQARERGLAVLPYCPYIRSWIGQHPEYIDLVPAGRRPEFGL